MILFRRYQELTVKDPPVIIIRFSDRCGSSRRDEVDGNLSEQWAIIRDGALISFCSFTGGSAVLRSDEKSDFKSDFIHSIRVQSGCSLLS